MLKRVIYFYKYEEKGDKYKNANKIRPILLLTCCLLICFGSCISSFTITVVSSGGELPCGWIVSAVCLLLCRFLLTSSFRLLRTELFAISSRVLWINLTMIACMLSRNCSFGVRFDGSECVLREIVSGFCFLLDRNEVFSLATSLCFCYEEEGLPTCSWIPELRHFWLGISECCCCFSPIWRECSWPFSDWLEFHNIWWFS